MFIKNVKYPKIFSSTKIIPINKAITYPNKNERSYVNEL